MLSAICGSTFISLLSVAASATKWDVRPFNINISAGVPHMLDLIDLTRLPDNALWPNLGSSAGIDLGVLKSLRSEWLTDFDWRLEEHSLNGNFNQSTVTIEDLRVHFIHQKSERPDAIPLILLHGWPGSFLEFTPVIYPLTTESKTASGRLVAFDVVVPSLPGFALSSPVPEGWTTQDTARVFNTLMTEVLGYKQYAVHGTDWGAAPAYTLYANYSEPVKALHTVFLPFMPPTPSELAIQNISLSSLERFEAERQANWTATGTGYFVEQTTKPNTIGLALQDNPAGQLAWIAEKMIDWSDPRAGTGPSLLTHAEILRSVSLYYLTGTFTSAAFIYYQNPEGFSTNYMRPNTEVPMLFSSFKYNVGFWPPQLVAKVGNLVMYRNHEFGGHFPGIDNPAALIDDLRQIGDWVDL